MFIGDSNDSIDNIHNTLLGMEIDYMAYPPPTLPVILGYVPKVSTRLYNQGQGDVQVFLTGIPKGLPLPYIPWALDLLLEEYGVKHVCQTTPNGCAKVWLENEEQKTRLITRDASDKAQVPFLLFDIQGVWVARSQEQISSLQAYLEPDQYSRPQDSRLPQSGLCVKEVNSPKPRQNPEANQNPGPTHRVWVPHLGAFVHPHPGFFAQPSPMPNQAPGPFRAPDPSLGYIRR